MSLITWYDDWSTTGRALVAKRGDLIKLGLAHPRAAAADEAVAPAPVAVAAPVAPAPVTPPATPHVVSVGSRLVS